jgi:small subunit ribosomal protein S18
MKNKPSQKNKPTQRRVLACQFCKNKETPDYKKYEILRKYVSERARIYGTKKTGVCSKHQRMLTREIKRARHLGLLPFTPQI